MLRSGEYSQPLLRPAFIQQPVVPGYATIRLRADLQFSGTGTTVAVEDNLVMALVENVGNSAASVQFRQVGEYRSGARSSISPIIAMVPGGRHTITLTPLQQYIELWGVTGTSQVRVQLETQVPWTLMAFDRLDASYPPALWQPASYTNT